MSKPLTSSNDALWGRRLAAVPQGVATAAPIFAARAENAEIWDVEGRRYIDFASGIAVLNVGHRHPRIIAAVEEQLGRFTHTAFQVVGYEPYVRLAEQLNALAPVVGPAKTIFFTTGAEATENAVKIARYASGRSAVIAFVNGFHGRTLLASAMTGKVLPYKKGFGPLPGDIYHIPFPSEAHGITVEHSLAALANVLSSDVEAANVAAIILEPVQGEGGFHVAPFEFLRALRSLCDEHGIALIADEVQTGIGRTGKLFAVEHAGVRPDLITVAKSLGGGFPLSAVVGNAALIDRVPPGGLGGTYAGSPIACAAGLAVLDVIEQDRLCDRAERMGRRITERLSAVAARRELPIGLPRGLGAMIAFDIRAGLDDLRPDGAAAKRVCVRALELGLILLTCGQHGEAIRLLAPLTASDAVLDEGLDILAQALADTLGTA
jgi:4-aminobutyrate aminotransferase/(S)-3-amino-2-methylpropionate transaminase